MPSAFPIPRARLASLRVVLFAALGLGVIAGMLLMADQSRHSADRARQAQVLVGHIGVLSEQLDATTWRSLGTLHGAAPPRLVARGVGIYQAIRQDLIDLRGVGVSHDRIAEIERPLGETYGTGMQTIVASHANPKASQELARTRFSPAIAHLNTTIERAARYQGRVARRAQARTRFEGLGSLLGGLLVLTLLGWRIHRMQRAAAVASQARAAERRGEERLSALVRHSSDVVAVIDTSSTVHWLAESVQAMLAYVPGDLLGRRLTELVHPEDAHRAAHFLREIAEHDGRGGTLSAQIAAADGSWHALEIVAENHLGNPDIGGILLNLRDVSERLALEEQLRHQAFHDSLTGLPNRALFEDRLTQALARVRRHGGNTAVIFIDLDDFKTINDSLGHGIGDQLLRVTSARLEDVVRTEDTAARLGGDEFAILLEDLDGPDEAGQVAERVRRAIGAPCTLGDRRVKPSASIGIATPDGDATAEDVLRNADVAMYAAKERGKGQVAVFESAMRERVVERLELSAELGTALEEEQLFLEYQPVVDLETGAITGVEALVRWSHPQRGRLAPDRFIGVAEATGLIVPLGRWVLETACEQLRRWDVPHLEMSVNVSTRQLADPAFPGEVRDVLERTGVPAERLTLEITEYVLLDDTVEVQGQLRALKDIGVHLAVDDFGTGYSALSYLQTFPIDSLKIDRSFVSGIDRDEEKARLVQGIVEMGHNLQLRVVTEGIEEAGEAELLRALRPCFGQGYLFSRPVDAASIAQLLTAEATT